MSCNHIFRYCRYEIGHIDEGMELLSGMDIGEEQPDGSFPEGTVNYKIESKLDRLAEKRKALSTPKNGRE